MIKKKVLVSRIKIALDVSREVKKILDHQKIEEISHFLEFVDEIIGILEGTR